MTMNDETRALWEAISARDTEEIYRFALQRSAEIRAKALAEVDPKDPCVTPGKTGNYSIAAGRWAKEFDGELDREALMKAVDAGISMAEVTMVNTPCGMLDEYPLRCDLLKEARRLTTLALDFWSAPGIDMPDIDTFNDMVTFLEQSGEEYQCKWKDGEYVGEGTKPVGMTVEQFESRESCPICDDDSPAHYGVCDKCGGASCPECGKPHELVRPGKTQPTCRCQDG